MGKITDTLKKVAEERFDRLERIAKIKERDQQMLKKIGASRIDPAIISYFDPKALITEQYKILRTNVLSLNHGNPPKVFVVTSSLHSEGKTVTSLNLAIAMAQTIRKPRILLIDADLRRGRVAKYLGINQEIGLSEYLSGQVKLEEIILTVDVENFHFIACGQTPENPAELLGSDKMKEFLKTIRQQFDYVILDTPPIISVTDSGIIGAEVDGVLMVIQAGRTQRGIVKRASELLHQTHSKILGYVLTNIEYHLPEYIYRYL